MCIKAERYMILGFKKNIWNVSYFLFDFFIDTIIGIKGISGPLSWVFIYFILRTLSVTILDFCGVFVIFFPLTQS